MQAVCHALKRDCRYAEQGHPPNLRIALAENAEQHHTGQPARHKRADGACRPGGADKGAINQRCHGERTQGTQIEPDFKQQTVRCQGKRLGQRAASAGTKAPAGNQTRAVTHPHLFHRRETFGKNIVGAVADKKT